MLAGKVLRRCLVAVDMKKPLKILADLQVDCLQERATHDRRLGRLSRN
jgi:hypothetical protein